MGTVTSHGRVKNPIKWTSMQFYSCRSSTHHVEALCLSSVSNNYCEREIHHIVMRRGSIRSCVCVIIVIHTGQFYHDFCMSLTPSFSFVYSIVVFGLVNCLTLSLCLLLRALEVSLNFVDGALFGIELRL